MRVGHVAVFLWIFRLNQPKSELPSQFVVWIGGLRVSISDSGGGSVGFTP